MSFGKPLDEASNDLYAAFGSAARPLSVPYCDHCVTEEEILELLAFDSLRDLPFGVLQPYASNLAFGTAGSPDDARYFLPRIMELALSPGAWPDLVVVASFLGREGQDWPVKERQALHGLMRALWRHTLLSHLPVGGLDAEEVLCASAHVVGDLDPFLAQ